MAFINTQFQVLFDYHFQTTFHLLDHAAQLSEAETKADADYGRSSIHSLFFHLLSTERGWRVGVETGQHPAPLNPDDYPDLGSLRAGFETEQKANQAFLDSLTEEDIQGDATFIWRGNPDSVTRWRMLQHLVLHGMQHHTEIAQFLTEKGQSPGDIDFIFFE